MANRKVVLVRYCRTESGWKRYPAVIGKTGKVKPAAVWVGKEVQEFPQGTYQLRLYRGRKLIYEPVGNDPSEALAARDYREKELAAEYAVGIAGLKIEAETPHRFVLPRAKEEFMRRKRLTRRRGGIPLDKETLSSYENIISEFLKVSGRVYADTITDLDLMEFFEHLRKRELSERTVANYYQALSAFLRYCKVDAKNLLRKEDGSEDNRPHFDDALPEAYTREEVESFLAACTSERDRLVFEFLLKTGMREREMTHCEWADIRWDDGTVIVRNKPQHGFRTKTGKSREITLESNILSKLKVYQRHHPRTRFLFGTRTDQPNGHYWEACKRTAHRAGLNCGACDPCKRRRECEKWYLHKFRSTFATWSLQAGVDLRTVQFMMGHSKIEMTERYLAPAKGPAAQTKMNAVFATLNA
jgi:integrase